MSKELQEISRILSETPMCFIATMDGTQPRVRAFQFQFEQDGKLWFCTARNKDVFKQLQANPAVEICAVKQDMTWLRLTGKMALADDMAVKERPGCPAADQGHLRQRGQPGVRLALP